jgi:hypothetical protein
MGLVDLENNDPDTLQLKDELDSEWVNLWHKATKKKPTKTQLILDCIPSENAILKPSDYHSKKTQ